MQLLPEITRNTQSKSYTVTSTKFSPKYYIVGYSLTRPITFCRGEIPSSEGLLSRDDMIKLKGCVYNSQVR